MKKLSILLFILVFSFVSCDFDPADDSNSFPSVDYSSITISDKTFTIPENTKSIVMWNCFSKELGAGEYNVTGKWEHTETATLNGTDYSNTKTKTISKLKVYTSEVPATQYHPLQHRLNVDFITDSNEILSHYYQWVHKNTNGLMTDTQTTGKITITIN